MVVVRHAVGISLHNGSATGFIVGAEQTNLYF